MFVVLGSKNAAINETTRIFCGDLFSSVHLLVYILLAKYQKTAVQTAVVIKLQSMNLSY